MQYEHVQIRLKDKVLYWLCEISIWALLWLYHQTCQKTCACGVFGAFHFLKSLVTR